jgi:hypothetical protein
MSRYVSQGPVNGVIEIKTLGWRSFEDFLHKYRKDLTNYIWRGQGSAEYKLLSSLDRMLLKTSPSERAVLREKLLNRFRFAARGSMENLTRPANEDEWWALGRHFGLATPLLDWTLSPYIAAFFAFWEPMQPEPRERVVYGLSARLIEMKSKSLDPKQSVRFVSPIIGDNPRLIQQRGLFSRAPDGVDIESWVRANYKKNTTRFVLIKILMPKRSRSMFLRSLERMAITPMQLFPDLTGAASYCNLSLEIDSYSHALSERQEPDSNYAQRTSDPGLPEST